MVKHIDEQCYTVLVLRHSVLKSVGCLLTCKTKQKILSLTPWCSYNYENSIKTALLRGLAELFAKRATERP